MGRRTHCVKGHEFTPENTYIHTYKKTGLTKRWCKTCRNKNGNDAYHRNPLGDWPIEKVEEYHRREKDNRLRSKYGISLNQYEEMFRMQKGLCAICRRPESTKKKMLSVDHNHATSKTRALLCHHCNSLLGHAKENPAILASAINYLEQHL